MNDLDPTHPPAFSERERIQALLDAGRISAADAELLFSALEDSTLDDSAFDDSALTETGTRLESTGGANGVKADGGEVDRGEVDGVGAGRAFAPASSPEPLPPDTPVPRHPPFGAEVNRWLYLKGGCGDLTVTVNPALAQPTFTGEGVLERQGQNYSLRTPSDWKSGNWLSKLRSLAGHVDLQLPEGYGLDLHVFAGDGTIQGVRALRGKFTGGDLTATGAEHLDLTVTSGDATLSLRPRQGRQRLRTRSGDLTLTFLSGSSVTVSGKATAGDISVPAGFSRGRGFGTTELTGRLGAGDAQLELHLTAGSVTLRAEGAPQTDTDEDL
jgi:hypothetical protein